VTEERAREDALARARQREDLLAHLVRVMRDAESAGAMLDAAAEAIARALGAYTCAIYKADSTGEFTVAARFGTTSDDAVVASLVSRAARAGDDSLSGVGSCVARCTVYRHAVNGVLFLECPVDAPPWTTEDRDLIAGIADQLGVALAQAESQAALELASRTDPLTGLLNRRAFEDEMGARLRRPSHAGSPGALLLIDLDNFKAVNDSAGHERGDEALKTVAALLPARTRPGDVVARLGGDEFAIWLERMDGEAAAARATALIEAAHELRRFSAKGAQPLGFSIGVAVNVPGSDLAALLARADAAMYAVKRRGKGGFQVDGEAKAHGPSKQRKAAGT
jgi:diguanylate cyclase (GGDEF)-like protein